MKDRYYISRITHHSLEMLDDLELVAIEGGRTVELSTDLHDGAYAALTWLQANGFIKIRWPKIIFSAETMRAIERDSESHLEPGLLRELINQEMRNAN